MSEELGNKALELIEKAEAVAPHVWNVLVKQAIVEGYLSLTKMLVYFGISAVSFWIARWAMHKEDDPKENGDWVGVFLFAAVVCAGFFVSAWMHVFWGMEYLMNPEYRAFVLLLDNLK